MKIEFSDKKPKYKKVFVIIILLITVIFLIYLMVKPWTPLLDEKNLQTIEVLQADIDVTSPVFGQYASQYERLITAPSMGQVSEIYVKAGAGVEKGKIIARLSNPDLEQEYFDAQSKLEQMQYQHKVDEYRRQNEQLSFQADLAELESELQTVTLDVNVNTKLLEKGIASKISLEKSILRQNLLNKRIDFSKFRYQKLIGMHQLEMQQSEILLTLQIKQESLIAAKVNSLKIVASISGTVQTLSIELGQRVLIGDSLARIGSKKQLIAKLNIPQRIAEKVKIGYPVTINHENLNIQGEISQLGSIVENGFIVAEAQLSGPLPKNIRPAQPLRGQVFVGHRANALYIVQQPGFSPMSVASAFIKEPKKHIIRKVKVEFGELSGKKLLINYGLSVGELLVTNDVSQWQEHTTLTY